MKVKYYKDEVIENEKSIVLCGLTTNVEFGYWLKSGKCIYGRPDTAQRTRYLDWLYNLEYKKEPHNNLEELLKEAIVLANKKGTI